MKRLNIPEGVVVIVFFFLALCTFRTYVFTRQVPLPFNLLAFLYSPWKYQTWPGYPLGVQNKPLGFDNLKLFYPYRKFTVDEMKAGRIPLWNPYVFSGNVHAATYQSAVFYPLNIVYFFMPLADAWSLLVIVQPILAGYFTYIFLRSLKQSKAASLLGSVGFAFSGWMISLWEEVLVLVHSFLWLPLALFASNLIWEGKRKQGFFLLALALSFSVLAGFLQMSIYVFITVFLWNFYKYFQNRKDRKALWILAAGYVTGICISAVQWLPAFEVYLLSSRGVVNAKFLFDQFLSPLWYLFTFVVPDFFGNPGSYNYFGPLVYIQERTIYIGIFLLVFALFMYFRKTAKEITFWKIFTGISLSLGFALPTSWLFYVLHVPILSVAQPARIFALSTFGLCVLAGYGFDRIGEEQSRKIINRIIYAIAAVVGALWIFVGYFFFTVRKTDVAQVCLGKTDSFCRPYLYATTSLRNLLIPTAFLFFAWFAFRFFTKRRKIFLLTVFAITIAGSLYFSNKMLYFSDRTFEYPAIEPLITLQKLAGTDRVWSYGDGYITRNMLSYFHIFSPDGYDALYSQKYGELLYTIRNRGKVTNQINRTDVTLSEAGQNEIMTANPYRLRMMRLLGVKYVLEYKETAKVAEAADIRFPSGLFSLSWENGTWRIWRYKDALPRVFIAHTILVEKNAQKIVDALYNPAIDLQDTVIVEDDVTLPVALGRANEKVAITSYESNSVTVQVQAATGGMLVLTDTYFPGWKAYVDGKETPIVRADYTFRAVPVDSGVHSVKFVYAPRSFQLGIAGSCIGIVAIVLGFLL